MQYYQYFWKIFWKYKWVLLIIIGISTGSAIAFCRLSTPLYQSTAEIYPLILKNNPGGTNLNPCYQVQRIVHSQRFHQLLIESKASSTLSESNYDRLIACHETPRHTLTVTARSKTPEEATALAWQFLNQIDYATHYLTSLQLVMDSNMCEQIPWDYYSSKADFTQDSPVFDSRDTSRSYLLFDILSEPKSSTKPVYPPNTLKTALLSVVLSGFFSFVGACLMEEVLKRMRKSNSNRP